MTMRDSSADSLVNGSAEKSLALKLFVFITSVCYASIGRTYVNIVKSTPKGKIVTIIRRTRLFLCCLTRSLYWTRLHWMMIWIIVLRWDYRIGMVKIMNVINVNIELSRALNNAGKRFKHIS
jgi:hypothetical protein